MLFLSVFPKMIHCVAPYECMCGVRSEKSALTLAICVALTHTHTRTHSATHISTSTHMCICCHDYEYEYECQMWMSVARLWPRLTEWGTDRLTDLLQWYSLWARFLHISLSPSLSLFLSLSSSLSSSLSLSLTLSRSLLWQAIDQQSSHIYCRPPLSLLSTPLHHELALASRVWPIRRSSAFATQNNCKKRIYKRKRKQNSDKV